MKSIFAALALAFVIAVGAAGVLAIRAQPAVSGEPRLPRLTMADLTDAQRPLGEAIMKISAAGIYGPYIPMLHSPVFGQRLLDLALYLRWDTSVPLRLNEFAILIISRQWRSQVEWFAHEPLAIKAGLTPQVVAELKANKRPPAWQRTKPQSTTSSPN
jgi:4-carboxymuconolactone decarboxylase